MLLRLQIYLQGRACLGNHLMLVIASAREWVGKMVLLASVALPCMLCMLAVLLAILIVTSGL